MLKLETVKYNSVRYIRNMETGTHFSYHTDGSVIKILEYLIRHRERVRLFYGEPNNGEIWHEENDVLGRIGRSMGPAKIPILIYNKRSHGGGPISTANIMAIVTVKGKWLYRHETFRVPILTISGPDLDADYPYSVSNQNGECIARFKEHKKAWNYLYFMRGDRFKK